MTTLTHIYKCVDEYINNIKSANHSTKIEMLACTILAALLSRNKPQSSRLKIRSIQMETLVMLPTGFQMTRHFTVTVVFYFF